MRPLTALCHRELAALHDRAGEAPRAREHRVAAATMERDASQSVTAWRVPAACRATPDRELPPRGGNAIVGDGGSHGRAEGPASR
jgi:hypothetical protein